MKVENRNKLIRDILLLVFLSISYYGCIWIPPHQTTIMEGDMSISRPVSNTISGTVLFRILAICGIVIILFYIFTEKRSKWSIYDATVFILLAVLITLIITQLMKAYVGRPRPSFFAICKYPKTKIGEMEMYGIPGRVADITKCQASIYSVRDAFMSFPSGHSSLSMCSGLFTFMLILRCLNEVKWIKATVMQTIKAFVFVICMTLPAIVGGSRIFDYKHSEGDVLAGFTVGVVTTLLAYYIVYGTSTSRYENEECESVEERLV